MLAISFFLLASSMLAPPQSRNIIGQAGPENVGVPSGFMILGDTSTPPKGYSYTGITVSPNGTHIGQFSTTETLAPMPTGRRRLGVASVGGKIYAIGGYKQSSESNDVEEYDPSTNTWSLKAQMPTPRDDLGVISHNRLIYAIGGRQTGTGLLDVVEVYDPTTDTWISRSPIPTARAEFGLAVFDDKIYVIGGHSGLNHVEVYDPNTDTWAVGLAPMPTDRSGVTASATNEMIVVLGGENGTQLDVVEAYFPRTDTWKSMNPMPKAAAGSTSVSALDQFIVVVGGNSQNNGHTNYQIFDTRTNRWVHTQDCPQRAEHSSAFVDGQIYLVGGNDESSKVDRIAPNFGDTLFVHRKK